MARKRGGQPRGGAAGRLAARSDGRSMADRTPGRPLPAAAGGQRPQRAARPPVPAAEGGDPVGLPGPPPRENGAPGDAGGALLAGGGPGVRPCLAAVGPLLLAPPARAAGNRGRNHPDRASDRRRLEGGGDPDRRQRVRESDARGGAAGRPLAHGAASAAAGTGAGALSRRTTGRLLRGLGPQRAGTAGGSLLPDGAAADRSL